MITLFRKFFQSKLGLFLTLCFVGLIAVAFAGMDMTNTVSFGGGAAGDNVVAKIGSEEITSAQLDRAARNAIQRVQQDNPQVTPALFVDNGGLDQVLGQLSDSYILSIYANSLNMIASEKLINSEITSVDSFKGASGQFDDATYRTALQQLGLTEAQLRDDIRRGVLADQMILPVGYGTTLTKNHVLPYAGLPMEARKGLIAFVPSAAFVDKGEPEKGALDAFYDENKTRYMVPERRIVRYASFLTSKFRDGITVSEKESRDLYNSRKAEYQAAEHRLVYQLVLQTKDSAEAIVKKVKGGQSIQEAAEAVGLQASDYDFLSQEQIAEQTSKNVAAAIFAAKKGEVIAPVKSALGWHIAKIADIRDVPAKSFESVRNILENEIKEEKTRNAMAEFGEKVEDRFSSGASFEDVVKDEKLKIVESPEILANGRSPKDQSFTPSGIWAQLLQPAFRAEQGSQPQIIEIQRGVEYAIVDVKKIIKAAPAPLAEIKDQVVTDYKFSRGSRKAKSLADKIAKEQKNEADIKAAVAKSDPKLPPIEPIGTTRARLIQESRENNGRVPPPVALMFSMAEGTSKVLQAPAEQGWFVVHVSEIIPGDASESPELIAQTRQQLRDIVANELRTQFINAVRAELKVEINDKAVKAVGDRLAGRGN